MSELNKPHNLADWQGDVESLILEMKRRAGVSTDVELAVFLGVTQGAVANWRRRGAVPESTRLSFERQFAGEIDTPSMRALLARALALRLVQFDAEACEGKSYADGFEDAYLRHAGQLDIIADECFEKIEETERYSGVSPEEAYLELAGSSEFFIQLSAWAKEISLFQVITRSKSSANSMARRLASHRSVVKRLADL
jgi:hypothetical protein